MLLNSRIIVNIVAGIVYNGRMTSLEELIASWPGEAVICRYDAEASAWVFIAIHETSRGPATGGTRIKSYPHPTDALIDAQRLAEGMTYKWRGIGIARGGGKAVIAVPDGLPAPAREQLLLRYARLLESLGGAFQTGCDLGTTPQDMLSMAGETRYVHGVLAGGLSVDPGPYTARGVRLGIEAALEAVFGSPDPRGHTILVEGLGGVGEPLARELGAVGATLLLTDLDLERSARLAAELDATAVAPAETLTTPCDVYAPCAVGGRLTAATVPLLACRIVAGSANNQLGRPEDAELLHARGILYAPDFVINGGGALIFGTMDSSSPEPPGKEPLAVIGDRLREIFRRAQAADESPAAVTRQMIE